MAATLATHTPSIAADLTAALGSGKVKADDATLTAYAVTCGAIGTARARRCISTISVAVATFAAVGDSAPVVRSMIETRSSSDGNGTITLNRNRSSWASGSG